MQLYMYGGVWLKLFRKITVKRQLSHENLKDAAGKQLYFSLLFSHSLHWHLPFGIVPIEDQCIALNPVELRQWIYYHVIQE